jgi:hypothetical protein
MAGKLVDASDTALDTNDENIENIPMGVVACRVDGTKLCDKISEDIREDSLVLTIGCSTAELIDSIVLDFQTGDVTIAFVAVVFVYPWTLEANGWAVPCEAVVEAWETSDGVSNFTIWLEVERTPGVGILNVVIWDNGSGVVDAGLETTDKLSDWLIRLKIEISSGVVLLEIKSWEDNPNIVETRIETVDKLLVSTM